MINLKYVKKKVVVQKIDFDGNISLQTITKMYIAKGRTNSDSNESELEQVSKDYYFLEWIDDDTYIFGDLSYIDAGIKYGVLKIKRDKNGCIIKDGEEIIVEAIYDKISQNNDKTVTVHDNDYYAYFDYEKGVQLTPVALKHAVPFSTDYEGFAECSTECKFGYLPRDAKPVKKEEDIKLLTEKQVKELIKYQKVIDNIYASDEAYKEITGHSYSKRKKYD